MESLHKIISALRAKICACNERRNENTLRFTMTNRMLLLLFPIFIVCMAELNQDKYLSKLVIFIADHPTIMLFNILIAGLIFLGALLLFRKGWLAMLLQSVLYMALSITELFKYNTNGNHLIMTDMKLFRSVKSLTSFAYIKITPRLIIFVGIVLAYIVVSFWFNPKFSLHTKRLRRMITGLSCLLACALVILVPTLSTPVYAFFGVDVSKYQKNIDWNQIKKAGVSFVIVRIGYRGYGASGTLVLDPMFEEHFTNVKNAGLKVGVYFFTQAVNEAEAQEEADGCNWALNGRMLDYPIFYDTEASTAPRGTGRADGLGMEDRTKCAIAFCEEVKAQGYKPGVYASTLWYRKRVNLNSLKKYTIWNAHYGVASSPIDCALWQGTCTARLPGYKGDMDVNISYIG